MFDITPAKTTIGVSNDRGAASTSFLRCTDESRMFSDTNSDECDEHRPERREARKVRHETRENAVETLKTQEVDRRDGSARRGVLHRKSCQRGKPGHYDDDKRQQSEERRRMRQGVPTPLHDVQKSVEYRFTAHEGI